MGAVSPHFCAARAGRPPPVGSAPPTPHNLHPIRSPPPTRTPRQRPPPPKKTPHARSGNALTGTLDPGLGRGWLMMEDLGLAINQLRGPIPPSFASMGRLNTLNLL